MSEIINEIKMRETLYPCIVQLNTVSSDQAQTNIYLLGSYGILNGNLI